MPKRKHYLWVCENQRVAGHPKGCCADKQGALIRENLKKAIAAAGLRNEVRVCGSSCLDLCWKGVAIAVMPENTFLGGVRPRDIPAIIEGLQSGQLPVELILSPDQFEEPK